MNLNPIKSIRILGDESRGKLLIPQCDRLMFHLNSLRAGGNKLSQLFQEFKDGSKVLVQKVGIQDIYSIVPSPLIIPREDIIINEDIPISQIKRYIYLYHWLFSTHNKIISYDTIEELPPLFLPQLSHYKLLENTPTKYNLLTKYSSTEKLITTQSTGWSTVWDEIEVEGEIFYAYDSHNYTTWSTDSIVIFTTGTSTHRTGFSGEFIYTIWDDTIPLNTNRVDNLDYETIDNLKMGRFKNIGAFGEGQSNSSQYDIIINEVSVLSVSNSLTGFNYSSDARTAARNKSWLNWRMRVKDDFYCENSNHYVNFTEKITDNEAISPIFNFYLHSSDTVVQYLIMNGVASEIAQWTGTPQIFGIISYNNYNTNGTCTLGHGCKIYDFTSHITHPLYQYLKFGELYWYYKGDASIVDVNHPDDLNYFRSTPNPSDRSFDSKDCYEFIVGGQITLLDDTVKSFQKIYSKITSAPTVTIEEGDMSPLDSGTLTFYVQLQNPFWKSLFYTTSLTGNLGTNTNKLKIPVTTNDIVVRIFAKKDSTWLSCGEILNKVGDGFIYYNIPSYTDEIYKTISEPSENDINDFDINFGWFEEAIEINN